MTFIIKNRKLIGFTNIDEIKKLFSDSRKAISTEIRLNFAPPFTNTNDIIEPIPAGDYFSEIRLFLEKKLLHISSKNSSDVWLYYLRRLPDIFFSVGNFDYNRFTVANLAEIATGIGSAKKTSDIISENPFEYAWDGPVIQDLLDLCSLAQQLKRVHALIRIAGKGKSFRASGDFGINPIENEDIDKAIRIYDQRKSKGEIAFLRRAGTILSPIGVESSYPILTVLRTYKYFLDSENATRNIPRSFALSKCSFSELTLFSTYHPGPWWKYDLVIIILLLRLGQIMLDKQPDYCDFVSYYGYIKLTIEDFKALVGKYFNELSLHAKQLLPQTAVPENIEDFLQKLKGFSGCFWAPVLGPVIRDDVESVLIDFYAASIHLEELLKLEEVKDLTKKDLKGPHFEKMVQQLISESSWGKVPNAIKGLENRQLKTADGQQFEIDVFGVRGDSLLIIDCCSRPFSNQHEINNYSAMSTTAEIIENKAKKWLKLKKSLIKNPVGKRGSYDFSDYNEIIPIVCTPSLFYIEPSMVKNSCAFDDLASMQIAASGLYTVSSFSEIFRWLKN